MSTRLPLIAGNWKMHNTPAETAKLLSALVAQIPATLSDREVVVAPPFTALETAARTLRGSPIRLSAQNLHAETHGAFTGEVSGPMLKAVGCQYVIIGHSERRQHYGETDEQVAQKVKAAQRDGLTPIVCVGETLAVRFGPVSQVRPPKPLRPSSLPMNQSGPLAPGRQPHRNRRRKFMLPFGTRSPSSPISRVPLLSVLCMAVVSSLILSMDFWPSPTSMER